MLLREIGVDTGGSNVQLLAVNPKNGRLIVIEMNPRVSRSSARLQGNRFPDREGRGQARRGLHADELRNDIIYRQQTHFPSSRRLTTSSRRRCTFRL